MLTKILKYVEKMAANRAISQLYRMGYTKEAQNLKNMYSKG